MAGFNVGGLPYFLQYEQQAQQQALQKQEAQIRMQAFQQQQQDRQSEQAAMAAAGNALPQLYAPPPPQQTPAPGQPSQPMMQPGQQPPLPPQGVQPPPQGGMPMPGQGPAGQVSNPPLPPGGVPPFRSLPTSPPPQQQAQPASILAPPGIQAPQPGPDAAGGPLSIQSAIKVLQDQGLSGAGLIKGLAHLQPVLDTQAKFQAAQLEHQFNQEFKLAQLKSTQEYHEGMLKNHEADSAQRLVHENALLDIAQQRLGIARQSLAQRATKEGPGAGVAPPDLKPDEQGNIPAPKPVSGYSSEALKAMGDAYAAGDKSVLSNLDRDKKSGGLVRAAVMNYAAAKLGTTGGDIATSTIENKAATRGAIVNAQQAARVGAAADALTTPGGIGDQMQKAADALELSGIPDFSKAKIALLEKAGDPRVTTLKTARNGVVSELAAILGRGTVSVHSLQEAKELAEQWNTPAQVKAGIAQAKREAATTVSSSRKEVKESADRSGKKSEAPAAGGLPAGWTVTEH